MNRNEATRTSSTSTVDYQARFEQLQTRFIDEPREAVREASTLVREAVDRLFERDQDTEQLRRVMQGYRDLLARLDGRQSIEEPAAQRTQPVQETADMRSRADVGTLPETETQTDTDS
jgi:hypothetical protein